VVISETSARRFWPDEGAIGKQIGVGGGANQKSFEVICVIAKLRSLGEKASLRMSFSDPLAASGTNNPSLGSQSLD